MSYPKTVILKNYSNVFEEYKASAGITPGMLVELIAAGTIRKHGNAGQTALVMFAIEDALQGKGITEAYVANDICRVWIPQRGDIGNVLLADGETVVIGDLLESDGAGRLRKRRRANDSWESADSQQAHSTYDQCIVGCALEAQDLSALDGSNSSLAENSQYIKVRFM